MQGPSAAFESDRGKHEERHLYLCGGLQGCGSTIVSWCFLQRGDMNGVLDGDSDVLPVLSPSLGQPFAWYKTTISSFRLTHLVRHYQDDGWIVHPLLIIRDVRKVWGSIRTKRYGVNGITAEDPPLRMRFRRFKEDWHKFQEQGWPLFRYEDLLDDHEMALQAACRNLGLAWDGAMLSWPKQSCEISDDSRGSNSFKQSRTSTLAQTITRYSAPKKPLAIDPAELAWLESEFRDFNSRHRYPLHLEIAQDASITHPSNVDIRRLRRYQWELRRRPIRWLLEQVGIPDFGLIRRFFKDHK